MRLSIKIYIMSIFILVCLELYSSII